MAKPEWGTKRICPNCATRYYDLRKDPPVCPACGTEFDPEALLRSRRARPIAVEEVKKQPASTAARAAPVETEEDEDMAGDDVESGVPAEGMEEEAEEDAPEDEEEVLIEDTSELGEDDMEVVDMDGGVEDEETR